MRVAIFALGFLTGQEMDRLPEAMRVLRDVLPEIEVTISSQYSPLLADALTKGKLDLAFMRAEPGMPDLTYQLVAEESLVAVLPSDHRLAAPSDGDRSRAAVTGWKQPVLVGEVGRVSGEERQEMRDIGLQQPVRPGPQRGLTNGLGGPLAVLSSRRSSDPPRRPTDLPWPRSWCHTAGESIRSAPTITSSRARAHRGRHRPPRFRTGVSDCLEGDADEGRNSR
jgi:DNA-binding transcriptional LysR family regulator